MEVLALIPARGGSKGIANKNLMELAGHSVIYYSIRDALEAKRVTRVIVSTDCPQIGEAARRCGAEVVWRPGEFATDLSPDIDTFSHTLKVLWERESYSPQYVVHLRPTMPLRKGGDIDRAVDMLVTRPDATSIRSVSRAKQSPFKMWQMGGGYLNPIFNDDIRHAALMRQLGTTHGKPEFVKWCGEEHSLPRQLLPQFLHQNGYIDVIRSSTILKQRKMAGDRVIPFLVEHRLYELDYPENIPIVEDALIRHQRGEDVFTELEAQHAI